MSGLRGSWLRGALTYTKYCSLLFVHLIISSTFMTKVSHKLGWKDDDTCAVVSGYKQSTKGNLSQGCKTTKSNVVYLKTVLTLAYADGIHRWSVGPSTPD